MALVSRKLISLWWFKEPGFFQIVSPSLRIFVFLWIQFVFRKNNGSWLLRILSSEVASIAFLFRFHWKERVRWLQLAVRKVKRWSSQEPGRNKSSDQLEACANRCSLTCIISCSWHWQKWGLKQIYWMLIQKIYIRNIFLFCISVLSGGFHMFN